MNISGQSDTNRPSPTCSAEDYYPDNLGNYSTVSGIAAYRSALNLDWFEKGSRQRDAQVFGRDMVTLPDVQERSDCMQYTRPAAGKISRLMLELLRNLEGDDDIFQELTHTLVRTKLLLPISKLEVEPDLAALVQTPQLMQGEPHVTLPRVVAVAWMLAIDPGVTKDRGWCPIEQFTRYLNHSTPVEIATRMRAVDTILARARFVMEDFIQNVRPRELPLMDVKPKKSKRQRNDIHHITSRSLKSIVYRSDFRKPTRTSPRPKHRTELEFLGVPEITENVMLTGDTKVETSFSVATLKTVTLHLLSSIVLFVV